MRDQDRSDLAVELEDVCVRYGEIEALHDATLRIPRGVSVAVIGPNGSGKSTLLGVLSGLVTVECGMVRVLGEPLPRAADASPTCCRTPLSVLRSR